MVGEVSIEVFDYNFCFWNDDDQDLSYTGFQVNSAEIDLSHE